MSKRLRIILVLVLAGIGVTFIFPTFQWYLVIPMEKKVLAGSSREQVREYSQARAKKELDELKALVVQSPEAAMPDGYAFLIEKAKANSRLAKKDIPKTWTLASVLKSFRDEREVFSVIEKFYHQEIMDLKDLRSRSLQLGLDLSGGMTVVLQADMDSLAKRLGQAPSADEKEDAIKRALEIITNRIDQFGVTEPQIRRMGEEGTILIEIPGDADPERVRAFLMGKGSLNFHIVDEDATEKLISYQQSNPGYSPENPIFKVDFVPAGSVVRGYYSKDSYGIDQLERYIVILEDIQDNGLDGNHIRSAQVARDPITNQPTVNFVLDGEGGEKFYNLTDKYKGKSLAIVMDNKVKAYARIQEAIRESVRITGFGVDEAQNLALVLRTAALPVDLEIINQQAVGASLGADAIRQGIQAILYGFILVVAFMLIYYKGAGLIANLALMLNLFFIIATLSVFNFTLTLTSIAGIVLTVGMAVDANVIIFERIKEEYRLGKSAKASIEAGFSKAFWSIMDANITTLIASIFLSQLGKGPIQGFAITLSIGIITSMFTALFVSRLIFDFFTDVIGTTKLSISWRRRA
jgi:preprotein translocase subunit SecD